MVMLDEVMGVGPQDGVGALMRGPGPGLALPAPAHEERSLSTGAWQLPVRKRRGLRVEAAS